MNDAPSSPATTPTVWDRYKPWRRTIEIGFWIGITVVWAIANTLTATMDLRRAGVDFQTWEPAVWEWTSHLTILVLVPPLLWFTRRYPLHFDTWRRNVPWLVLGSVVWSVLHVTIFVTARKLIYAVVGETYDFGPWWREFGYEYLKDFRGYAFMVAGIESYRLLLRRMQGEASILSRPDDVPAPSPDAPPVEPERPERFLVRKLGKEFLIAAADVEWLQAMGNYVNLHVRGREYPLRATMATIETQLDPARFVRVHRSYIVNLDNIGEIEPLDTGDARITLRDGATIPCSRKYRNALR